MVYPISRYVLKLIKGIFVKQTKGLNNLPSKGPFILAVNHASYLDPALIYAVVLEKLNSKVHSIAQKELFKHKIWDLIYRVWWEAIPLNGAVEKAIKCLEKNEIVCIFPEGGRTATGKIGKPVGTGVAVMALKTGSPVIPVYLRGTFETWSKHNKLPRLERSISVIIGKPMKFKKKEKFSEKELKSIANKVMNSIKKLN